MIEFILHVNRSEAIVVNALQLLLRSSVLSDYFDYVSYASYVRLSETGGSENLPKLFQ